MTETVPAGAAATETASWLFVPGSRPERFDKACAAGAGAVIIDLEDAVSAPDKQTARDAVATWLDHGRAWVRINSPLTEWHRQDLAELTGRQGLLGVVVPKSESAEQLRAVRAVLPRGAGVLGLVESARGIAEVRALAPAADRLLFGSVDYALDLGMAEIDEALLSARSSLVLASRLAGLPAPVDGVTTATGDEAAVRAAAERARALGFGGKLCIHPRQVAVVESVFTPSPVEIAWARRVVTAALEHGGPTAESGAHPDTDPGAFTLDGEMIDRPVILRARRLLSRASVAQADQP